VATTQISIFLLARSLEVGGAERQLVALAKGLHERGYKVTIGLFYRRGELLRDLEDSGIPVVDLGKKGRWDLAGFVARTAAAVRGAQPDVIYSFLGGANLIAAAIRPFVRSARYVWSVRASNMQLKEYGLTRRLAYRVERTISNLPDLIIANSSAGAAHAIRNGFPAGKLVVIPNGIDFERFRPDAKLRAAQRRKLALKAGDVAVGVMARLDPMKGHKVFLEAAAIAAARAPKLRFLCIGEGPELPELERIRDELGLGDRLSFTGPLEPVSALNALDIACSCSVWGEGFSNSVAEAMACGLPVIVTDVGDSAMIAGNAATVVPARAPEALADAILAQAAALDRHDPGVPRARIVENFSPAAMVERTLEAFRSHLGL
jgi:glycosyltransferase involved in cell wall biosynthesis